MVLSDHTIKEALAAGRIVIVPLGEGDAVDDDVQASELLGHPFECGLDVVVGAYVALDQGRVPQ